MEISPEETVSFIKDDCPISEQHFISNEEFQIKTNDIIDRIESENQKHCENLRMQIDLKVESIIEKLNKERDDLFNKINKFQESKTESAKKYFNEEKGKELIEGLNIKLDYLMNKSNKVEMNTIIQLGKVYEEKELIVEDATKIGYLYFHHSVPLELNEQNLIGYLDEINDETSIIWKLKYIGKNEITYGVETEEIKESLVAINENGLIAICFNNQLLVYENNELKIKKPIESSYYKGICMNNNLLALFSSSNSIDFYDIKEYKLLQTKLLKRDKILKIFMNDYKIFVVTEESPFLRIFDKDFNHIESVEFPQAPDTNEIFIGSEKIFFQKRNKISYLNVNNGFYQNDFIIENSFEIVSISSKTSEIITYNSKERIIRVYKCNGTVIGEFRIPNFWGVDSICMHGSGKIVVNDKRRKIVYSN